MIGDTSLRASVWPEPRLMKKARRSGFAILAGSDPLPVSGEENRIATYVSAIETAVDPRRPADSLRRAFRQADLKVSRLGRRSGPIEMLARLLAHAGHG